MRKRHIAFLCKLYLYYLINGTIKKKNIKHEIMLWFYLQRLSETFYDEMGEIWSKMYISPHVK